jgi:hypothetical protein
MRRMNLRNARRTINPSLNLNPSPIMASIDDRLNFQPRIFMMISFRPLVMRHACIRRLVLPACAGIALLVAPPVHARGAREREGRIAECIRQAADGKPWLEMALWGLRDQEGGWLGAEVRNTNGSHDLGPLQINTWWVPKIAALVGRPQPDVRVWLMHDACFNAGAARWIFLSALRATGDFWKAVGVYHSPNAWRQRRYASSVAQHMQRRFGRNVFFVRLAAPVSTAVGAVRHNAANPEEARTVKMHGFGVVSDPAS